MHHGQPSSDRVRISILVPGPKHNLIIDIRKTVGTDCNAADNSNAGCGVQVNKANSYGPPFNSAGGGWYAMERTDSFIKVWFWTRNAGNVPSDVKNGATSVNTDSWVRVVPFCCSCHERAPRTLVPFDCCRARRMRYSRTRTATSTRTSDHRTS